MQSALGRPRPRRRSESPRRFAVGLHWVRGQRPPRLDKRPGRVADRTDGFSLLEKTLDKGHRVGVAAQLVRSNGAAGNDERVVVVGGAARSRPQIGVDGRHLTASALMTWTAARLGSLNPASSVPSGATGRVTVRPPSPFAIRFPFRFEMSVKPLLGGLNQLSSATPYENPDGKPRCRTSSHALGWVW